MFVVFVVLYSHEFTPGRNEVIFKHVSLFLFSFQHIDSVVDKIERGYRMECPDGCPRKVYDVMRDCWDIDPSKRPTFKAIHITLDEVHQSFLPVGN